MNASDVKRLIRSGETDEVEFKREPDQTVLTVKLDASGMRKASRKKTSTKSEKTREKKTREKDFGFPPEEIVVLRLTAKRLVDVMKRNPLVTTAELSQELGVTDKGIEWQILKLRKDKIIRRVGGRKFGHWEVLI